MIQLRNVSKAYPVRHGAHQVLDDITIDIPVDENLGVLGKNGTGKSTLIRLLAGIEAPDKGEIIRHVNVSWPIGFKGGFNNLLTAEENVRFIARIYSADLDKVAEYTRSFSELGEYYYMPVHTFSAGMRARLAFGVSMAIGFRVYLVDELVGVGDGDFQDKCQREFEKLSERSTVIIVSHNMKTLRNFASRYAVLNNGKITLHNKLSDAMKLYRINMQ